MTNVALHRDANRTFRVHGPCRTLVFAIVLSSYALAGRADIVVEAQAGANIERERVWYGGREAAVDLNVLGNDDYSPLRAVLVQQAHALAAPHEHPVLEICAPGTDPGTHHTPTFRFTPPEVKRITRFTWEFASCAVPDDCTQVGEFSFTALPAPLLEEVAAWSGEHATYVEDASGRLSDFLENNKIDYTMSRRGVSAADRVITIIVADDIDFELDAAPLPAHYKRRVLLFKPYDLNFPLVEIRHLPDAVVILVSESLFTLSRDDHAFELMFYRWFMQLMR